MPIAFKAAANSSRDLSRNFSLILSLLPVAAAKQDRLRPPHPHDVAALRGDADSGCSGAHPLQHPWIDRAEAWWLAYTVPRSSSPARSQLSLRRRGTTAVAVRRHMAGAPEAAMRNGVGANRAQPPWPCPPPWHGPSPSQPPWRCPPPSRRAYLQPVPTHHPGEGSPEMRTASAQLVTRSS